MTNGSPADPRMNEGASVAVDLGFTNHLELRAVRARLRDARDRLGIGESLAFIVRDPDLGLESWPGSRMAAYPRESHRPWRAYLELLRVLGLTFRTPERIDGTDLVRVVATRFDGRGSSWGTTAPEEIEKRYGAESTYRDFDRLEEPEILDDYEYAAARIARAPSESLLTLGCNDGRELEIFAGGTLENCTGVDLSESAVRHARAAYPDANFHAIDLGEIENTLEGRWDVVLALNVLQCRTVDRDALLAWIVRNTHDTSRILISIPNCHRGRSDILRRPADRRDPRHDRSLVFKDARHYARVLHRSGQRRVEIFGTYDVFVLATPEGGPEGGSPPTSE